MLYFGIISSDFVQNLKSLVFIPIIYHVIDVVYLKSRLKPPKPKCIHWYTTIQVPPALNLYWGPLLGSCDLAILKLGISQKYWGPLLDSSDFEISEISKSDQSIPIPNRAIPNWTPIPNRYPHPYSISPFLIGHQSIGYFGSLCSTG